MSSPLLPLPAVPSHARRFRSDDLDQVRSAIRRTDGEHWRVAHGAGRLGFDLARVTGQDVQAGWCRTGLGQTVRGSLRGPCLHFPLDQTSRYVSGRQVLEVEPGAGVFVSEAAEYTRHSSPGEVFAVQFSGSALAAEWRARRPDLRGDWSRLPRKLHMDAPRRQVLADALAAVVAGSDPSVPPAQRALSEGRLVAAVADMLQVGVAREISSTLSARRLADLEDWIEAHLAEPVTLGCLCSVVGVGERALQMGFQSRRGMSPMRFVTERRLAAAHRRLTQAGPGDDVTGIAIGAGFSHLGRFSTLYRQVYGEPPSRTLRSRSPGR